MNLKFHNLRYGSQPAPEPVNFDDLTAQGQLETNLLKCSIDSVDPFMERDPKMWQQAFATAIFVITGCSPEARDLKLFRRLYSELKQRSKTSDQLANLLATREFTFGALPYIAAGLNFTKAGISENGNNNLHNLMTFIESLSKNPLIASFFCAHRERVPELVETVDVQGVIRACRLALGITDNMGEEPGRLKIYQPRGSGQGIASVFPEIFMSYFQRGELWKLSQKLEQHFTDLEKALDQEFGERVQLVDTETHVKKTLQAAENRFGQNWQSTTIRQLDYMDPSSSSAIIGTILETAKGIARMMPFYRDGLEMPKSLRQTNIDNAKHILGEANGIHIEEATDAFIRMPTAGGKAIYETAFYEVWGGEVAATGGAILGFERDQHVYQSLGISLGYNQGQLTHCNRHHVPAVYAKRSGILETTALKDLSFRQFWRTSERD